MRTLVAVATICIVAPYVQAAVEDDLRDGDKYFEDGDWKKAAAAYDRAIDKAPGQVAAEAYGKRAAIFIILKDYKGGLDFIAKAKTRYPNAPEILEQEALILWQSDKRDDAIKVAEKVVKAKPSSFSNQQLIGEYYSTHGDPVKTAAAFEAYLANRPAELEGTDVLPRIRLGFAYIANARDVLADGDEDRAKQLYTKAAEQFEYVQRKLGKKPNAMVNSDNGLCAAYAGLGRWDNAINVCEKIIQDPKHVDTAGSAWFNLGRAYLARKQTKKARSAGNEFTRLRKNEARGYILLGETYFEDRDWSNALDQFLRAEKALKPNQPHEQVQLSIWLGKTYRRLPAPASGNNPNLNLAIEKLASAYSANPTSFELAAELGGAYLEAKQDAKATVLTDKLQASPEFAKAPVDQRASVMIISGKSLFNQKKLKEAKARFEAARQLKPNDVQIQRALVTTINEQAFNEKDPKASQDLLNEALKVDPSSATTLTNVAVLAIDRGDCDSAQKQLMKLPGIRGSDSVKTARLLARTYLCQTRPDPRKASEAYGNAEREAKKANAQLALAEIYTEWAPLLWDTDVLSAVDKLEQAVQIAGQDADIAPAAKRNLALGLYRRGWKSMREGKAAEATTDFERALRDPSVLKGSESLAFEFSLAVSELDSGRSQDAAKQFRSLAAKGNQGAYLKGPYAKVGSTFFAAYANYRSATGKAREGACNDLAKLEADLGNKAKELSASCWEMAAAEDWRGGNWGQAAKELASADAKATAEQKRRLTNDHAALNLTKDKINDLEGLAGNPPEALVNLGILYDMIGKPKDAYEAWTRAKAKGVNRADLQKWIDAKKRIYGY